MNALSSRRLVLVLFGALLSLPLLLSGVDAAAVGPSAPALDPSLLDPSEAIPMPIVPDEDGQMLAPAMGIGTRTDAANRALAPIEIHRQTFEGDEFPPPGWSVLDAQAQEEGVPPRYTFSREMCLVQPLVGGTHDSWAVGGGSEGEKLPCGTPYPAGTPVWSWLVYTLDTRPYPAGLQVNLRFRLDQPTQESFLVCATTGDVSNPFHCYRTNGTQTGWTSFVGDLDFSVAANQADASVFVSYQDPSPAGTHFGVFVDNIVIKGLLDTPSPTIPPQPPTATNTPTPATPSPTPKPTEPPIGNWIYIPMLAQKVTREDIRDAPIAQPTPTTGVGVRFGVNVDSQTGEIEDPGSAFQVGVPQLCVRVRWWGQDPEQDIRWQWYKDGRQVDIAALNGTVRMHTPESFVYRCAGQPPVGVYEVRAYVGDAPQPAATGSARVQTDPVPGKPTHTPEPTQEGPPPTNTPGPTPEGCSEQLQNGGFEDGPAVWQLATTAQETELSRVIRLASTVGINPIGGEWVAVLGGGLAVEDQLSQPSSPTGLVDPARLDTATLHFYLGYVTEEVHDGVNDDGFFPIFVSQGGVTEQPPGTGWSEEHFDPNSWYEITVPVTAQMTRREGWDSSRILFISRNDHEAPTFMLMDEVSLTVCLRPAASAWLAGPGPAGVGLRMLEPREVLPSARNVLPAVQVREAPERAFPVLTYADSTTD